MAIKKEEEDIDTHWILIIATCIQHSNRSSWPQQLDKRIKGIQIGKEETKFPLFLDDMIIYIDKSKIATKNC
jgi:hypothetical protein